MIPSVVSVHSVEMIRDGGSLAAVFQGADGCKYWLFLEVRLKIEGSSWETLGYEAPVVLDCLADISTPITQPEAESLLQQMIPLLRTDSDRKWHQRMQALVADKKSTDHHPQSYGPIA